jgi:lipoprotein-releasing system ATP-binding protein
MRGLIKWSGVLVTNRFPDSSFGVSTKIENRKSKIANRLVVRDLRKAFRSPGGVHLEVLRGVSFTVSAGEVVAVMGASGAGKSTLLHLLGGLEAADDGQVVLGDFDLTRASGSRLAAFRNESIGFVFQFHHLLPDLTAAENVVLPLVINRCGWRESRLRVAAALERVRLDARKAAHRVGHLSGGEQQRVAVARALVKEPRLVLCDEPTGNLDAEAGEQIIRLLISFCHERAAAGVVATHNEGLASLCDRRLLLRNGSLESRVWSQKSNNDFRR